MASSDITSSLDIDKALDVASRRMGYERLFPKQREAVEAFISGRDVFVCLLTGYGYGFQLHYFFPRSNNVTCCCTVQHSPVKGLVTRTQIPLMRVHVNT